MADEANDELVSQFLAFTGSADVERASSYLEMSGGDLETAVGLFMEHTSGGGGGGVGGDGGDAGDPGEAAASPAIRAPDETRTMRLMDHEPHHPMMMMGGMPLMGALMEAEEDDLMEGAMASAFARAIDPRAAVNAAAAAAAAAATNIENSEDYEHMDESSSPPPPSLETAAAAAAAPTLGDLFAPPTHLIHKGGGFQGARSVAKDARRWLLVNIQKDSEFSSHALNRDVWRDELVENLIREGFIFWQTVRIKISVISCMHSCCGIATMWNHTMHVSHLFCFFLPFFPSSHALHTPLYRWTTHPRVDCMPNDTVYMIFLICPLLILGQDVSCGARRDGRRNILSPRKTFAKWPWTFVLAIRSINRTWQHERHLWKVVVQKSKKCQKRFVRKKRNCRPH